MQTSGAVNQNNGAPYISESAEDKQEFVNGVDVFY